VLVGVNHLCFTVWHLSHNLPFLGKVSLRGLNPFGFTVWLLTQLPFLGKGYYGGKTSFGIRFGSKATTLFFRKAVCNGGGTLFDLRFDSISFFRESGV